MGEGRYEIRWQYAEAEKTALGEAQSAASTEDALWMEQPYIHAVGGAP